MPGSTYARPIGRWGKMEEHEMTVRIGILGFAHGHVNMYCQRWRETPALGVELVAGWDHDAGRLAAACGQFGVQGCETPEALLARADVEAVVIAAETSWHAELAEAAARAGRPMAMQKPLALTLEEADRIVQAVEAAGVPFSMAWQMRVDPQNVEMKRLVDEGVLGRLFMVRRRHGLPTHVWPGFKDLWHIVPELNRDIWCDDAAHAVDFLLWLLGEPESVSAEIESLYDPDVPMDNGIAVYRYAGGPLAEVCCSFVCMAGENTTEIVGEKGVVVQNYGDVPSCNVPRPEGAPGLKWYLHENKAWTAGAIASPAGHGERIAGLAAPLAGFLQGTRAPLATVAEGRTALRMTLAAVESARTGRRVLLDGFVRESV